MSDMPAGLNTAISSGAAFGGKGGAGPGSVYTAGAFFGKGLGEGGFFKSESSLFTGELQGGSVLGGKGFGNTGIFSGLFDAIFVGIDSSAWGSGTAGNEGGGGGGGGEGGGDSAPFSAIEGTGIPGFSGAGHVDHKELGALFPDPTPGMGGREHEMERGG